MGAPYGVEGCIPTCQIFANDQDMRCGWAADWCYNCENCTGVQPTLPPGFLTATTEQSYQKIVPMGAPYGVEGCIPTCQIFANDQDMRCGWAADWCYNCENCTGTRPTLPPGSGVSLLTAMTKLLAEEESYKKSAYPPGMVSGCLDTCIMLPPEYQCNEAAHLCSKCDDCMIEEEENSTDASLLSVEKEQGSAPINPDYMPTSMAKLTLPTTPQSSVCLPSCRAMSFAFCTGYGKSFCGSCGPEDCMGGAGPAMLDSSMLSTKTRRVKKGESFQMDDEQAHIPTSTARPTLPVTVIPICPPVCKSMSKTFCFGYGSRYCGKCGEDDCLEDPPALSTKTRHLKKGGSSKIEPEEAGSGTLAK